MRIEKDYEELLGLLNKHQVKYCIVGAYAIAFYGKPRYTKDIDILIEPSVENGKRIVQALNDFGFGSLDLSEQDFVEEGNIIQLGYEPVRVDIITSITGVGFREAWENKVTGSYGKEKIFFIGLKDLIRSKEMTGRKQDAVDVEILRN
ncbi:MAG: hypothetical protein JW883_17030 [Deltaproteobacteria bacterium]|nr:hypothetical protein [Deltaproteobacteria bacterium]